MTASALNEALGRLSKAGWPGLDAEQTRRCVTEIIDGSAEPALIAAFLTAIACHGVTASELVGAVTAARSRMTPVEVDPACRPLLDTCGTGGDGANTVNISTAAALVVASCGVRVAKHGNRSASGNSGSAEVLSELGINIESSPTILNRCLVEAGIMFFFAPRFHPAMKHAAPVRRLLPFRTLFNLVGPLANPASPEFQLIGAPDVSIAGVIADALDALAPTTGTKAAFVVAGTDGLDEISLTGANRVFRVGQGQSSIVEWGRDDFGLHASPSNSLVVSGPADSAAKIRAMLAGEQGSIRDVVLANASAALWLVGRVANLREGVAVAGEAIDRGDAARLLSRWAEISHQPG